MFRRLLLACEPPAMVSKGNYESSRQSSIRRAAMATRFDFSTNSALSSCANELFRVIDLPVEVDPAKTTATLENGVLELDMAKGAPVRTTRVVVKAA
jgi:HSP20 family molecular chaperone IbpA